MGCGCKNKGNNQSAQPQPANQVQQIQPNTQTAPTQQSVQETIKKTIEKYYTIKR